MKWLLGWPAASALLVAGVVLVATAIETGPWWLSLIGYGCLFFVVPITIDAASYRLALRARAELTRRAGLGDLEPPP